MRIVLNGEEKAVDPPCTITRLLERWPAAHRGYAVEINRRVIPRREHETHELHPDDVIEIVTLVGGG